MDASRLSRRPISIAFMPHQCPAPRAAFHGILKLRLPFALSHILAGLRIASGLAVIGAIVGEFITGAGIEADGPFSTACNDLTLGLI
jgi:hypothetical protein